MTQESPSYVPSLFAFTTSPERKRIYNSLSRFEAVQRRRQSKEVEADYLFNNEPEPAPILMMVMLQHYLHDTAEPCS